MNKVTLDSQPNRLVAPTLIKAREAKDIVGLSLPQTYTLVNKMPAGVVVRLGKRVRFNRDALLQWVANGGTR